MTLVFTAACLLIWRWWKAHFPAEALIELLYMQIEAPQVDVWCALCPPSRTLPQVSSACAWLCFPLLGPNRAVSSISPLRYSRLGPVMMKDMSPVNPALLPKKKKKRLNLVCAAKKTNHWCCVHWRCMSWIPTAPLDGLTRNQRLTGVTYCMLHLKTHKQTKKAAHV